MDRFSISSSENTIWRKASCGSGRSSRVSIPRCQRIPTLSGNSGRTLDELSPKQRTNSSPNVYPRRSRRNDSKQGQLGTARSVWRRTKNVFGLSTWLDFYVVNDAFSEISHGAVEYTRPDQGRFKTIRSCGSYASKEAAAWLCPRGLGWKRKSAKSPLGPRREYRDRLIQIRQVGGRNSPRC